MTTIAESTGYQRRRIHNPIQNDTVTFLETSREPGGERTLAELDVAPGGKVTPHSHVDHTESFHVIEGRLNVRIGETELTLGLGDAATMPAGAVHAWETESGERTVAHIELRPGPGGFETALRVAYGLAAAAVHVRTACPAIRSTPRCSFAWGNGRLPGAQAMVQPLFGRLARLARRTGTERALLARYA